jgi:ADP-ribose pyrophosphatase YjhB (NUDIX family)
MSRNAVRVIMVKDGHLLVMHRNKFGHEYYSLIGGGVDVGESLEQSLIREVKEETTLDISNPRLVYVQESGKPFGTQHIFWADYPGGEVNLSPASAEAKINELKKNLYTPLWLPISKLPEVPFLPTELKDRLIEDFANGFANKVVHFSATVAFESPKELERRLNGEEA